jgi:hypothetical protein
MDAGGRAMQEQLPSLRAVNEHFCGGAQPKFNAAKASKVIFQGFPRHHYNVESELENKP